MPIASCEATDWGHGQGTVDLVIYELVQGNRSFSELISGTYVGSYCGEPPPRVRFRSNRGELSDLGKWFETCEMYR